MNWTFEQLPISVNSPYVVDLSTESKAVAPGDNRAEVEATSHWLFGTDFPDWSDMISGQRLRQNFLIGNVATGGSGYTTAQATIVGGGGSGATAGVVITGGAITRVYMLEYGNGDYWYNPEIIIAGDGTGAVAPSITLQALPVLSANSLTPGGIGAGMQTQVRDRQVQTICGIFKLDTTSSGDLFGCWPVPNPPYLGGFLLWFTGSQFQTNTTLTYQGGPVTQNNGIANPGLVTGDWFMAVARHDTVETVLISKAGTWGTRDVNNIGPKWPTTPVERVIGIGGINAGHNTQMSCAEFMTFDYALSDAELDDLLARSTARMAARGIALA